MIIYIVIEGMYNEGSCNILVTANREEAENLLKEKEKENKYKGLFYYEIHKWEV